LISFIFIEELKQLILDESVKSQKIDLLSFRPGTGFGMTAKPESSHFNSFWTPAPAPDADPEFAGVTGLGLFTKASNLKIRNLFALARFMLDSTFD
jgi:hypothetical protein